MPSSNRSILIIDEHTGRKTTLSSRLRMQGFTIDVATGGFHGLHLAEKNQYNLVMIIDDMEDMPAYETLGLLRHHHDSASLPVIVLRSQGHELDIEEKQFLEDEQVNEVAQWQNEFNSIMRKIQRHLV